LLVAVLGALIAAALTPIAPPGVPVIAASAAALLGLRLRPEPPGGSADHPEIEGDLVG
jgi:hypothetical protein